MLGKILVTRSVHQLHPRVSKWSSIKSHVRSFSCLSSQQSQTHRQQPMCMGKGKLNNGFLSPYHLLTPPLCSVRGFGNKKEDNAVPSEIKDKEYIAVYYMPQILFVRVVHKVTKYCVYAAALGIPLSQACGMAEIVTAQSATNSSVILAMYAILFVTQGALFSSKIIGKIMISEDEKHVKFSCLSLFGDRRDIYMAPSKIIPLKGDPTSGLFKVIHFQGQGPLKPLFFFPKQGSKDSNFEAIDTLLQNRDTDSKDEET